MRLGAAEVGQALPPVFVWWRDFAARYIGSLCLHASGTNGEDSRKPPSASRRRQRRSLRRWC